MIKYERILRYITYMELNPMKKVEFWEEENENESHSMVSDSL